VTLGGAEPTERRYVVAWWHQPPDFRSRVHEHYPSDLAALRRVVESIGFDCSALPISDMIARPTEQGVEVEVSIRIADRNTSDPIVWGDVTRVQLLPWRVVESTGADGILRLMRDLVIGLLCHEVDESFLVAAQRVFDPHRPVARRAGLPCGHDHRDQHEGSCKRCPT
jgi:hypothetical protein